MHIVQVRKETFPAVAQCLPNWTLTQPSTNTNTSTNTHPNTNTNTHKVFRGGTADGAICIPCWVAMSAQQQQQLDPHAHTHGLALDPPTESHWTDVHTHRLTLVHTKSLK